MILLTANSLKPFAFESIQILGLPNGSMFRARFPIQWVERKFVDKTEDLVGEKLLYSVRIWETDEVLPLRHGKIVSAKQIGDILFVEYSLDRLVSYSSKTAELQKQIQSFKCCHDARLAKIPGAERAPSKEMKPLIVEIDEYELLGEFNTANFTSPNDDVKWMTAVNMLGGYTVYNGLPFYKFEIVEKDTGEEIELIDGRALLTSGKNYILTTVYVIADSDDAASEKSRTPDTPYMEHGPYQLKMSTDESDVEISPRIQPLSGRYDKFDFLFSAKSTKRVSDTLRLTFSVPEALAKSYRPVFDVPIIFRPSLSGIFLRSLSLGGLLIVWICLNFQDDIREFLTPKLAEYLSQFSLVFFALACVELVKYVRELLRSE